MDTEKISPQALKGLLDRDRPISVIDVRSPAEFRAGHIAGARSVPLDNLIENPRSDAPFIDDSETDATLVLTCQSGMRAERAATLLRQRGRHDILLLDGGTDAWASAALPMQRCTGAIAIERQVQITVGLLLVLKVAFGFTVHELFFVFAALLGAGLIVAGVTRWCGLARLMALMPWNRGRDCSNRVPV
jgi:rhodanese-related sulfurtransferase